MTTDRPTVIVLAGPNGAGKSTFFEHYLKPSGIPFVNADVIARALSAESPAASSYAAAKVADIQRRLLVDERESFCMETVFSDPAQEKLSFLVEAQDQGYRVILIFIGLDSPELSQARVIGRVAAGGHDVPDEKIFGRYPRTLQNLKLAAAKLDEVRIYDNSSRDEPYRLVARLQQGSVVEKHPPLPRWMDGLLPS